MLVTHPCACSVIGCDIMARVNLDTSPPATMCRAAAAAAAGKNEPPAHTTPQHSTTSQAAQKPALVLPARPQATQPVLQEVIDESQPDEEVHSPPRAAAVSNTAQDIMQRWRDGMSHAKPSSNNNNINEPPSAQSAWRQPAPRVLLPPMACPRGAGLQWTRSFLHVRAQTPRRIVQSLQQRRSSAGGSWKAAASSPHPGRPRRAPQRVAPERALQTTAQCAWDRSLHLFQILGNTTCSYCSSSLLWTLEVGMDVHMRPNRW